MKQSVISGRRTSKAPVVSFTKAERAFTLVELLVSIAIIGVLITCTLWALAAVRNKSKSTAVVIRLQQHSAVFSAYCNDYRDCFPYFTRPIPEETPIPVSESETPIAALYFEAYHTWNAALADGYYSGKFAGGPFQSPFWQRPGNGEPNWWGNDFLYPCVFLATPEYWNRETREFPLVQLSATRLAMVSFPARKSLIVHDLPYNRSALAAACVDGHASPYSDRQIEWQTLDDGALLHRYGGHRGIAERMMHTINGVKGKDVD